MKDPVVQAVSRIVIPYAVFAGLWILLSDRFVGTMLTDPAAMMKWSMYKGWAFVLVTAMLLFWRLNTELRARERADAALRGSEELVRRNQALLEAVSEATPDAVYVKDTEGRYLMFNAGACRIVGKRREEVLGQDDGALFSAEDARQIRTGDRRVLDSGTTQTYEEFLRVGGQLRTFLATKGPVRDPQGKIIGLFGIARDITERKQAEQQLHKSEQRLRALSARLQTLREEERARISREIHDELGQMLTGIIMDLRWIENRLDDFGDDPRVNPVLDKLVDAAELTSATLKTVQRIAAELRPGILDKLGLLPALQYEASRFSERTSIPCRLLLPDEELELRPEAATAFFRIFQEALTNVVRHAKATTVEAEFQDDSEHCRLEIRDDGKGMAEADLLNPQSIGLLGMQERARLLGGDVLFSPHAPKGTTVSVRIPRRAAVTYDL